MTNMETLQEKAIGLWTRMVEAMRADGLIANVVTQSGPATTAVIVEMVQGQPTTPDAPWLGMTDVLPGHGREVVARDLKGALHILWYDANARTWMKGKARARADKYVQWRFVDTQGVLG